MPKILDVLPKRVGSGGHLRGRVEKYDFDNPKVETGYTIPVPFDDRTGGL